MCGRFSGLLAGKGSGEARSSIVEGVPEGCRRGPRSVWANKSAYPVGPDGPGELAGLISRQGSRLIGSPAS